MEKISLLCSERLLQVNKLILEKMASNIPLISEIAEYILTSGGKRIRPLLALSSAKILKYEGSNKDICLASAVELIHTATLLHDDVVDKSNKRRNKETANEVWGNEATILVGDFLFSRAFELMVETNSLEVLRTLSQASCKISEGEMDQLISQNNPSTSTNDYIKIIKGKTAELFSAACKAGALISTKNQNKINALKIFGEELGISYQLVDDALDYLPDNKILGKSIGDDFKDGKISYPIIVSWENGTDTERKFWKRVIKDLNQNSEDFRKALNLINKYNGIKKTYELAKIHSQNAIKSLSIFENSEDKESLIEVAEFSLKRLY
jgi:octaprenyl-diphosphate synthase